MTKEEIRLADKITKWCKSQGLTWTGEQIFVEYVKWVDGWYISHTAKLVILKFQEELEKS